MTVRIITAHVLDGLRQLEAESVHCVVTSPPYYGLRDYGIEPQVWGGDPGCEHEWGDESWITKSGGTGKSTLMNDGRPDEIRQRLATGTVEAISFKSTTGAFCLHCNAWRGSLGLEPTLDLYLDHMVEIFREIRRVLRCDGTVWCNIGDSYCAQGGFGSGGNAARMGRANQQRNARPNRPNGGLKSKDLMLIPSRLAIRLCDDGWWVRSDIAWCKKAPMPESCTDRPTTAWEHVFLLTKSGSPTYWTHRDHEGTRIKPAPDYRWQRLNDQGEVLFETAEEPPGWREDKKHWRRINLWDAHDYFYDQEAVKEEAESADRPQPIAVMKVKSPNATPWLDNRYAAGASGYGTSANGKRNLRNHWLLGPEPFPEAHFATFPSEIPRICIKAGTSERGVCPKCGAGWERCVKIDYSPHWKGGTVGNTQKIITDDRIRHAGRENDKRLSKDVETIGWRPTCKCADWHCPKCATVLDIGDVYKEAVIGSSVQDMRDRVPAVETRRQLLQSGLLHDASEKASPANLRSLRDHVQTEDGRFPLLRPNVQQQNGCVGQGDYEGLDDHQQGLPNDPRAGSSERDPLRLCDGTPSGGRKEDRSLSDEGRGCSSQERGQTGQLGCESGVDDEKRARRPSKASLARRVPALSRDVPVERKCPGCGSILKRSTPAPIPGTVLDCFLGAGTTGLVADRLGRHCIGIELSPAYARMAENRVRSDAGMFAEIAAE